jgi:hypothetical protein
MQYLLLPFFILRLLLAIFPFFIKIFLITVYPFRIVLGTTIFFAIYLVYLIQTIYQQWSPLTPLSSSPLPLSPDLSAQIKATGQTNSFEKTPENLTLHRQQLLQQLELQPTHRDVLINLFLLETAAGNAQVARIYLDRANEVDPNHPVVRAATKELL